MRRPLRRRGMLIGAAGVAVTAGTLAAAWRLGKPSAPDIRSPPPEAAPPKVRLLGAEALKATDPPVALAAAELVDTGGRAHGLADFAGKGLVVNLWATWCVPCVAELPALASLANRLGDDGILVLPLSSDRGGAAAVEAFFRKQGIAGLEVWLDPKGAAARAWGARGIPTTLIVDRHGRERARAEGPLDWASETVADGVRRLVG